MFRGSFTRVNFWWIILALCLSIETKLVRCHSCHEVKTAFQVRQIGPLKWVPETPEPDVDLFVCKHKGLSCCTRKMEESYQVAVRRETVQNIHSYSFELNYLLLGHTAAFQDTFQSLMTFSMSHISSLFESTYSGLSLDASPLVTQLFSQLSLYARGGNASVEATVHTFFDDLFPLVYGRLLNPALATETAGTSLTSHQLDCLRMTRQDVNPFGEHPGVMARELGEALRAGRALAQALSLGMELVNITDGVVLTRDCTRALVRMQYCSHCRGLTLIKPCSGYCLNVLRGCLAGLSELNLPWQRHVALLEDLTHAVAGQHSLELALLGVEGHVNEAILYAMLHGVRIVSTVDKVCGPSTPDTPISQTPTADHLSTIAGKSELEAGALATSSATAPPVSTPVSETPVLELRQKFAHLRSSFPLKHSNDKPKSLKKISREFVGHIPRYMNFFGALPEMLCEAETGQLEFTCWSGDDVVMSYTKKVVGNGVHAQRQNPELKVRGADPALMDIKDRLEHFSKEIEEMMPGLGQRESWETLEGSGEAEGSSGECDDEDGCQGSGDATGHPETPNVSGGVTQPGSSRDTSPQESPSVVRVRGDTSASSPLPSRATSLLVLILLLLSRWTLP